ncbi:MAG TPA: glycine zipper family protein [Stellaceae bacterium]|nr:glycine zipper family protein [Stellaceae bacterium]
MKSMMTKLVGGALVAMTVSTSAMAQYNYDAYCRQYADSQTAGIRQQAANNAVGSTLLGAALGAGIGAAVGGGRGAGIGAASGAIVGGGAGGADAANANAYADQQAYAYYQQCMAQYAPRPPATAYGAPAYGGGYPSPGPTTEQLNQQQLQGGGQPGYYPPYR